ncbi:Peroxiredoxin [Thermoactinomyces sp. DSM 45891]|uniref:thiol-disulfide oxidoreductase ResA n=1 Tax=Thermoactinomyces sp. DSM 45891 TaxID=1761907 RepID=UPI000912CE3C|nr:thiol-disulfide oxidoreductase ResA [Thermoactinomyces sp. DSM 45891]SFX27366.1 Peroxiredoxin [Thermoactinomyces sp. DSM 45891]
MNKQTRYWVRRLIFVVLIVMVGYTIYQMSSSGKQPGRGDVAPNFTLTTLDGKKMSLSDLKGKGVMLNFWGTWCEPCKAEMPAMKQVYKKYQDKGFEIVAVNVGESDVAVHSFMKSYDLDFPVWLDPDKDVTRLYRVGPIPSTFFIDDKGIVARQNMGELNLAQLEVYVNEILPKR